MTDPALSALLQALDPEGRPAQALAAPAAILVTVAQVQGSAPREEGAWMAVLPDRVINTLGGGHLELEAMAQARALLADPTTASPSPAGGGQGWGQAQAAPVLLRRFALGPALGQCCGGVVQLRFEPLQAPLAPGVIERLQRPGVPLALFGGGHVGKALVRIFGSLPLDVRWFDSRDEIFPSVLPANVQAEHSDPIQDAVAGLPPGSRVLVMSFSHAEDLDIVQACLKRQRERGDLTFIGLIGSATKWATFRHRLRERGHADAELDRVTCPIGVPGITGKTPEVIAVAVAAQILQGI